MENPQPGEWNVKATSDSAHSVRLTAISDIVFNFGFTLKTPQRISDTFFNPLQGNFQIEISVLIDFINSLQTS